QVAALVHAVRIALWAVAVKLLPPFHHVCLAAVFFDEFADAVVALAPALGAFDAERGELALDVAEDEIGARHLRSPCKSVRSLQARCSMTFIFSGALCWFWVFSWWLIAKRR